MHTANKVLVANRGEIAVRVLRSAVELGWETVSIYTENDISHASFADEAIKLDNATVFLDVDRIVDIAIRTKCTHVHPGYGFLSENSSLPVALSKAASPIIFIGPAPSTLLTLSDKMLSRELATSLGISIAPGRRVYSSEEVKAFARSLPKGGYPIMIKALDGGGGRGIRVVQGEEGVEEAFKRCLGESPSHQVFAEKALTGLGWKHIEVQIIGDGTGSVNHFWERECSVQRRFQKVVEMAPSLLPRPVVEPLLAASIKLARHLKYKGLGTFEFLINTLFPDDWVFLEINPRVQVEHTITEEIMGLDLVRTQLLLFTSPQQTLSSLNCHLPPPLPKSHAIQLRLIAEDPSKFFQLSPGHIHPTDLHWPSGPGVRVDTWLCSHASTPGPNRGWTIGTEFDSLLAKIIVRAATFAELLQKAKRALNELRVDGDVRTNLEVLQGVLVHPEFERGEVDTTWLERRLAETGGLGRHSVKGGTRGLEVPSPKMEGFSASQVDSSANILLQPGTLFHLTISPSLSPFSPTEEPTETRHTLSLTSIQHNAFPALLSGSLHTSLAPLAPLAFSLTQSSTGAQVVGDFELADPNDTRHVGSPMMGKVVELHPALASAGQQRVRVQKGEAFLVLSVMKMENVVLAQRDGYVTRVGKGVKVGVVLGEGTLICVFENQDQDATVPSKL